MTKAKLTLTANPEFSALVPIPIPGGEPVEFQMSFRGRNRQEFENLAKAMEDKTPLQMVLELCTGWELADPFNADNLATLLDNYFGAADAIVEVYCFEVTRQRRKN